MFLADQCATCREFFLRVTTACKETNRGGCVPLWWVEHCRQIEDLMCSKKRTFELLPTARKGKVFTGMCHSVHCWPHGYSFTANPCYCVVGYASYRNVFLLWLWKLGVLCKKKNHNLRSYSLSIVFMSSDWLIIPEHVKPS